MKNEFWEVIKNMSDYSGNDFNPNDIFYHYTSEIALEGILEKRELWATNFSFLNDKNEILYGIKIVIEKINYFLDNKKKLDEYFIKLLENLKIRFENENMYPEVFVTSFIQEKNKNDVNLWERYGNYNLGFKWEIIQQHARNYTNFNYFFSKVIYDKGIQMHRIDSILRSAQESLAKISENEKESEFEIYRDCLFMALSIVITFFKHKAFINENEVRAAGIISHDKMNEYYEYIHFTKISQKVKPYIKLIQWDFVDDNYIIEEILIGPTNYPKSSEKLVNMFLKKHNYKHIKVEKADVPLRNNN